jgi:hypothetical protein
VVIGIRLPLDRHPVTFGQQTHDLLDLILKTVVGGIRSVGEDWWFNPKADGRLSTSVGRTEQNQTLADVTVGDRVEHGYFRE